MENSKTDNRKLIIRLFALLIPIGLLIGCQNNDDDISSDDSDVIITYDYTLVASGQTSIYDADGAELYNLSEGDAFFGQDGNYLKGATMSYIDNSDGTTSDLNTGLMWQTIPLPEKMTYDEAIEYCENIELAGYDDWRAPNLKELFSISDFGKGWPYLDTTYFKLASGIVDKSEQFWSSNRYVGTTVEGQDNAAFGVNHVTGHIKAYAAGSEMEGGEGGMPPSGGGPQGIGTTPTDSTGAGTPPPGGEGSIGDGTMSGPLAKYIRAVRGDEYGTNDYVDNGDGTITDKSTGLMWTQDDSGEGMIWEDALFYAENSIFAGYDDWRLPNVKEHQAIVDYGYSPTATAPDKVGPAIDPIFNCTQIISEAGYDDYPYYWTSTSANFSKGQLYYYAWYISLGRAVNDQGEDFHGAGAVRFDTKDIDGPAGEDAERYYNYVRLVRNAE
ncbi:DUF1566 domain-containing protein [uncultured Draconibacterium sp.]|uniref:Lcl C-terminal domain-containing protein n=1 Tax=uncultured Draconibacterium sp. TaxID=1573823 RepID=UPI0029C808B2|nr:DUF1566 domain-containing protein [uncultured Draconibacterium sp.]